MSARDAETQTKSALLEQGQVTVANTVLLLLLSTTTVLTNTVSISSLLYKASQVNWSSSLMGMVQGTKGVKARVCSTEIFCGFHIKERFFSVHLPA